MLYITDWGSLVERPEGNCLLVYQLTPPFTIVLRSKRAVSYIGMALS